MPREIGVVGSSPLGCGARLSQLWSRACLSYTWRVVDSTLLGLLDKCLGTPAGGTEFPQEPIYGWSHSADMATLITGADILGVSPCHRRLL